MAVVAVAMALPAAVLPAAAAPIGPTIALVPSPTQWFEPSTGTQTVHIVGQVQNLTGGNVTLVTIPVTWIDAGGSTVGHSSTLTSRNVIKDQGYSPFEDIETPPATVHYDHFSIDSSAITYARSTSQAYALNAASAPCRTPPQPDEVCGIVTNNSLLTVDRVNAILTYVDTSTGDTVGQNKWVVDNDLGGSLFGPGDQGYFQFARSDGHTSVSTTWDAEPGYPVGLNPVPLDLGRVNVGKIGQHDLSLKNNGSLPVTVSAVGTSSPEFGATTDCPGTGLLAGQTCHVTVQFAPAAPGTRTGTLTITDDAAGSPQTVPLTGTGTAPHVTFSPSTNLDFGTTERAGMPGLTKNVTLINDGTGPLSITAMATDNAPTFSADRGACPAPPTTLPAGTQCTASVTFAAAAAGPYTANLVVSDDAGTGTQTLPLVGFASGPGDQLSPTSIDFHNVVVGQTGPAANVSVTNNGNESLTVFAIKVTGDFGQQNNCGTPLPVSLAPNGGTCTFSVTLTPTQTGNRSGSLTISDNTFAGKQSVTLSGKGVNSALSFSPASLDFGTQSLGSSTVLTDTVTNQGSAPLIIKAIAASGDYTEADDCGNLPRTLPPSDSCRLTVTFKPTDVGTRPGAITISDNTQAGTDVLQLTGNVNVFTAMYTLDGYGGITSDGGSPQLGTTAYWKGWKIARSAALLPDGSGGFVLDGYGGLHEFGSATHESASAYFGWDIARDVALLPSSTQDHPMGYTLDGWGGVHPFGGAPDVTGTPYWRGRDVALRIALLNDGTGGYELDAYGGLHPFAIGSNTPPPGIGNNGYWVSWRIVRSIALNPASTHTAVSGVTLDGYGGVHPFNSAGDRGLVDPSAPAPYFGFDIARAVVLNSASTAAQPRGWVLDGWGGLHAFGGARQVAQGGYWRNFDIGVQLMLR